MEADWSVEIGPAPADTEPPEIIVPWQDWIDLRNAREDFDAQLFRIPAAAEQSPIAAALRALNEPASPWLTSKCDFWNLDNGEIDPFEFDAADLASPLCGFACYVDVLARDPQLFASFTAHETLLRILSQQLRTQPHPHSRAEFVLRAASCDGEPGFAITAYAFGCGIDVTGAQQAWETALALVVSTLLRCG